MSNYHDIGALSVRLNLQTNDFNKKISSINKQIRSLETDFKSASKGVKNFENTFQGVNTKIKTLTQQLSLSNTKLKEQENRYKEFNTSLKTNKRLLEEYERDLGKNSTEYKKQAQLVAQLAEKTRAVGTAINKTKGDIRAYTASLKENQEKMKAMEKSTKSFSDKLKFIQEETKMTASSFAVMSASLQEGSFKKASADMQKLSAEIEGAKKQVALYNGEIAKLESAYTKTKAEQKTLTSEIKRVNTAIEHAKNTYGENSNEVNKLNDRLMVLKTRLASTRDRHHANAQAIRTHRTEMNLLNTQIMMMTGDLNRLPLDTVSGKFISAGQSLAMTGATLSATVGLPLTLVGKNAVQASMSFEEGMSKVQAISNATGSEIQLLTDQARQLGATTQFSATEATEAMQYLSMAGLDVNEVMTAMPGMLDLAKAGFMDLATTADISTNILSGFGKGADELGHLSDVLAYASSNANTNIEQMGEAMIYLAPVGNTLGLSLEDVSSAVMAVSDAGIQGARAGAAFSTSLVRLTKPTEDMQKLMDELNISFANTDGTMKPIHQIVDELNVAMGGFTDTQKASAINTLFGAEATKHWASLLDVGGAKLKENTDALKECDGTASRMADTMSNNLAGSVKEMKSKIEEFLITVGNALAPTIETVAKSIGNLAEWFKGLSPTTQQAIVAIGGFAVVVPLATTALGFLTMGFGNLFKIVGKVGGFIDGKLLGKIKKVGTTTTATGNLMTKAVPLLTNPWTLLIGSLFATGVAMDKLHKENQKKLKGMQEDARNTAVGVGSYFETDLPNSLSTAVDKINSLEFFDQETKNKLARDVKDMTRILSEGGDISGEMDSIVKTITQNFDQIPEGMREQVVKGLVEMGENIYKDGKGTKEQFEAWIAELQEASKIKIEVDMSALENARKVDTYIQDFTKAMADDVGTYMHSSGNDVAETVAHTSEALIKAKDVDIETYKQYASGIAQYLGEIKTEATEQTQIVSGLMTELYTSLDPSQLASIFIEIKEAYGSGTDGIKETQQSFFEAFEGAESEHRATLAKGYYEFISQYGGITSLLQGEYGRMNDVQSEFWVEFVAQLGLSGDEAVAQAKLFKDAYVNEINGLGDDATGTATALQNLVSFIGGLVEKKVISIEEARLLAEGVNAELGTIDGEVTTIINADISNFTNEELEVLKSLGVIDEKKAEAQISANNEEALKMAQQVERTIEQLGLKIEETNPVMKVDGDSAKTELDTIYGKIIQLPLHRSINVKVNTTYTESKPKSSSSDGGKTPKMIEPQPLAETYSSDLDTMATAFSNVRSSLSNLDYSSHIYTRQRSSEPRTVNVTNSNDSTMISLLQSMVENIEKMNQRQNTLEAQLYIDGRQLKSHMEVIDKRANRLSGR